LNDQPEPTFLDRAVELLASVMDALGLNGRRLRWKWSQKRIALGEAGMRGEQVVRSATGKHKMCPACRALVERSASNCPECGVSLAKVKAPGAGRMVANLFPGVSSVTSLILLVNGFWFVVMLLAQMKAGGADGMGLFSAFGGELLVRFGSGLSKPFLLSGGDVTGGEWWRFVTPIFLHAGLIHFFFNSYLLLHLGPIVEEHFGRERFWVIYLLCGISGAAASQRLAVWREFTNTVGASGAIFGLTGLLLVYGMRSRNSLGESMKSLIMRLMIFTLVFSLLARASIDHTNHVGGFVCGALLALIVPARPDAGAAESRGWQAAALGGVLLVLYCFYKVATISVVAP